MKRKEKFTSSATWHHSWTAKWKWNRKIRIGLKNMYTNLFQNTRHTSRVAVTAAGCHAKKRSISIVWNKNKFHVRHCLSLDYASFLITLMMNTREKCCIEWTTWSCAMLIDGISSRVGYFNIYMRGNFCVRCFNLFNLLPSHQGWYLIFFYRLVL